MKKKTKNKKTEHGDCKRWRHNNINIAGLFKLTRLQTYVRNIIRTPQNIQISALY